MALPETKVHEFLAYPHNQQTPPRSAAETYEGILEGAVSMMHFLGEQAVDIYEWSPDGDEDAYVHTATLSLKEHF